MEWIKLFVLVFAGVYLIRFLAVLVIELLSEEPTKIKAPKIYDITLMVAVTYIITYFIDKL